MAKLSITQQDVLDRMTASQEPLLRLSGGFWTLPSIALAAGYVNVRHRYWKPSEGATSPAWWVAVQTCRAMERKGLLRPDPDSTGPAWARPYVLVPETDRPAKETP